MDTTSHTERRDMTQTQRISAALERNLDEAMRLNDTWLILRALHDEAMRRYDFGTASFLQRASQHAEGKQ